MKKSKEVFTWVFVFQLPICWMCLLWNICTGSINFFFFVSGRNI